MKQLTCILAASLVLAGCASQSINTSTPSEHDVETERTVDANFDEAWETLVGNLSKSFFVINNIEKESRIINVSFSTNDPGQFVDCGSGTITVNEQSQTIRFTEDAKYPYVYRQGAYKYVGSATRNTDLEGRVNIYMQPKSDQRTQVSANAKYVMSVEVRRVTNTGQKYEQTRDSLTFQSTQPGTSGEITCVSRGTLEGRILKMAVAAPETAAR